MANPCRPDDNLHSFSFIFQIISTFFLALLFSSVVDAFECSGRGQSKKQLATHCSTVFQYCGAKKGKKANKDKMQNDWARNQRKLSCWLQWHFIAQCASMSGRTAGTALARHVKKKGRLPEHHHDWTRHGAELSSLQDGFVIYCKCSQMMQSHAVTCVHRLDVHLAQAHSFGQENMQCC